MSGGLAPVKGPTLPLMSYGGSSMIATLAGFGLILNVRMRVHESPIAGAPMNPLTHDQEMIVSSNGHHGPRGHPRGRPAGGDLRRARASPRRRRQRLQGPGLEGPARHAVVVHRHRPRARRLPLRLRRPRQPRRVRQRRRRRPTRTRARRQGAARTGARPKRRQPRGPKIEDLLKEGQDVIVQVAKEPLGTKGARLTSHVTLPGRFLVFMPTVDHIGVSRKIDRARSGRRLRGIVREFREAARLRRRRDHPHRRGPTKEDILSDLDYFHKIWMEMRQKSEGRRAAGGHLPGAEPGQQAAARPADRGLLRDPHRRRAGARADRGVHRRIMPSLVGG